MYGFMFPKKIEKFISLYSLYTLNIYIEYQMQNSILPIDYTIHENHLCISTLLLADFEKSDMVMLVRGAPPYNGVINSTSMLKIPFDTLHSYIAGKSLAIFADSLMEDFEYLDELIKTNKNICFGCTVRGWCPKLLLPLETDKFVLVHSEYVSTHDYNFDFSGSLYLQNVYQCSLAKNRSMSDSHCKNTYSISNNVKFDELTVKLPYGCSIKVIDDFSRLID